MSRWFRRERSFEPLCIVAAMPDDLRTLGRLYPGRGRASAGVATLAGLLMSVTVGWVFGLHR